MVKVIASIKDFDKELQDAGDKLIVVDFFATWCGPCKVIAPVIEGWSTGEYKDSVIFLKVDVDEASDLAEKYGISAMPTFFFFKNGSKVHEVVGASQEKLKSAMNQYK